LPGSVFPHPPSLPQGLPPTEPPRSARGGGGPFEWLRPQTPPDIYRYHHRADRLGPNESSVAQMGAGSWPLTCLCPLHLPEPNLTHGVRHCSQSVEMLPAPTRTRQSGKTLPAPTRTRRRMTKYVRHQCTGCGGGRHTGDAHSWIGLGPRVLFGPRIGWLPWLQRRTPWVKLARLGPVRSGEV
jgi:hypothetical protein